ncbi:uncharacterized protein LOC130815781 [Amaranthus tricolor]|uniref:uncharacterized protein LOC130815781 n=1 Tax=Amaranthus tricolor TaxID=29722 RepID=UPI00258A1FBA|nr:uncharacterized protein LOC130815781 [Amaranthus tricolor]
MNLPIYAFLLYIFALSLIKFCCAIDFITSTQFLTDPETILSNNSRFRLGFFGFPNSTNRYVGIWYDHPSLKEVVWVANRNNPLTDSSGVLKLSADGNLQVISARNEILWSSNVTKPGTNFLVAQLLDYGNLVIKGFSSNVTHGNGTVIWQSFYDPTDSILPEMGFRFAQYSGVRKVQAWKSPSDPSKGRFSIGAIDSLGLFQITINDGDQTYWRSGPWNGNIFIGTRYHNGGYGNVVVNIGSFTQEEVGGMLSLTYAVANQTLLPHYVLTYQGILTQRWWDDSNKTWEVAAHIPEYECDTFRKCGEFGNCNPHTKPICSCLRGFEPMNKEEWSHGNWTSGCKRRKPLECNKAGGGQDGFLKLQMMKVPENAKLMKGFNVDQCRSACLTNCSCLAYTFDTQITCMIWIGNLIDVVDLSPGGVDLYIRLAQSELDESKTNKTIIVVSVILTTTAVAAILCFLWWFLCKRSRSKREVPPQTRLKFAKKKAAPDTFVFRDNSKVKIDDMQKVKFEKLVEATDNFHESNLLGTGGFGQVYKGKLEDGQEIAVKRLSTASRQGTEEFMNEVELISKLQHRNLVKLLGCCIEGEERMLIYEYLPNKSLDAFLLGKHQYLDWKIRFNIIEGICRGLLYLHRDSRFKIIHRDLKLSNILLDKDLNPKISDFGMARIFESNQDKVCTQRVVGTYGYMAPEYAMKGHFSEKSDIFSFGVLLIEILSGERNNKFSHESSLSLLGYAWKLWNEDNIISLIDPMISGMSFQSEIVRCLRVALLCVQENPKDRPNTAMLVSMLVGDTIDLPSPKAPGFTTHQISADSGSPRNKEGSSSLNNVTITTMTARKTKALAEDEEFKTKVESVLTVISVSVLCSCLKSHHNGGELDHLVAYSLACTLEGDSVCAKGYGNLYFGSLDEVIKVGDFMCLDEGKGVLMEGFEGGLSGRAARDLRSVLGLRPPLKVRSLLCECVLKACVRLLVDDILEEERGITGVNGSGNGAKIKRIGKMGILVKYRIWRHLNCSAIYFDIGRTETSSKLRLLMGPGLLLSVAIATCKGWMTFYQGIGSDTTAGRQGDNNFISERNPTLQKLLISNVILETYSFSHGHKTTFVVNTDDFLQKNSFLNFDIMILPVSAFLLYIFPFCLKFCYTIDTIIHTQYLKDPEAIVSNNTRFTLGFFSIPNTTNRYVGIWYNQPSEKEVIWVANRNSPLTDSSGVLKLSVDGNLQVSNARNEILWSSNVTQNATNFLAAQLLDSGNLVIQGFSSNGTRENGTILWESFQNPTDSIMPKMSFSFAPYSNLRKVRAWRSPSNPSKGRFSIGATNVLGISQIIIYDGDRPHWRTGPWNGNIFIGTRYHFSGSGYMMITGSFTQEEVGGSLGLIYAGANETLLSHYVLTYQGIIAQRWWDDSNKNWKASWHAPENECDIYGKCGDFGLCNPKSEPICSCLKGFEPKNVEEWRNGNWTSGCKRRKPLQCGQAGGGQDGFLRLQMMKVPENAELIEGLNVDQCRSTCLTNCSCLAYSWDIQIKCMTWSKNMIDVSDVSPGGIDLYLRLAQSELNGSKKVKTTIVVSVILATVVVAIIIWFLWRFLCWRSRAKGVLPKAPKIYGNEKASLDRLFFGEKSKVTIDDLKIIKFDKLVEATENFHESNLLGSGGFGQVYKGKLEDGQEIAVKRLSRASRQGTEEFMNEVELISKLQHRNLVKLLGCCVENEERMLIYEYLPNKSLDALLFEKREHLDWQKRFMIIEGICRGLLYLHRDSRFKIIHRDLKLSNILLDKDLNPKISDFGMARIFESNQDKARTQRVVGTYGYMAPEYAMEGHLSEKSDVFSLGVLLIEIVSGKKINKFSYQESLGLLGYAWKLWNEDNIVSLIDPSMAGTSFQGDIIRCIRVGLLCVQENAKDRPNTSVAMSMLVGDTMDLPSPKKPAFTIRQISADSGLSHVTECTSSMNNVTMTTITAR